MTQFTQRALVRVSTGFREYKNMAVWLDPHAIHLGDGEVCYHRAKTDEGKRLTVYKSDIVELYDASETV